MPAAAPSTQQALPGSRYSIPPLTDKVEQPENNDGTSFTPQQGSQVQAQGIIPFMQSDVVAGWMMYFSITETVAKGTGAIAVSPYFPEISIGPFQLNMQYQYPAIDVNSLADLRMITEYRNLSNNQSRLQRWQNPTASNYSTQSNVVANGSFSHTDNTAETYFFTTWIPASCWFDQYFELDEYGNAISGPHNGFISPQNMGGYARVVTPSFKFNPLLGTPDGAPFTATGSQSTPATATSLSGTYNIQRIGWLGNVDASVLPQPTNWQYNIAHLRWAMNGVSKTQIPLNSIFAGQIMSICVRMYDPSANSNVGAPLDITALASASNAIQLQYAGSVQRWTGSARDMQRRFYDQHQYSPNKGLVILDLATDEVTANITNSYLLNTLRTAACQLNLSFTSATSSNAYAEITIEGLRYVPLPVQGR